MKVFGRYFDNETELNRRIQDDVFEPLVHMLIAARCFRAEMKYSDITYWDLRQIQKELLRLMDYPNLDLPVNQDTLNQIASGKIPAIKVIRERTYLGLKEAKDLVEAIMKLGVAEYQRNQGDTITVNGVTYKKVV